MRQNQRIIQRDACILSFACDGDRQPAQAADDRCSHGAALLLHLVPCPGKHQCAHSRNYYGQSNIRRLKGYPVIRVIYRWQVGVENRDAFIAAWTAITQEIHATTKGARGSFCIVGVDVPTEIVTVARWDELEQWREFVKTAKSAAMAEMHRLATPISHAAYEEIADFTV
jgi:heme-degrading monooxygenase HmoA